MSLISGSPIIARQGWRCWSDIKISVVRDGVDPSTSGFSDHRSFFYTTL
jgi:hypothetical protein